LIALVTWARGSRTGQKAKLGRVSPQRVSRSKRAQGQEKKDQRGANTQPRAVGKGERYAQRGKYIWE